jgi:hypothetical protein
LLRDAHEVVVDALTVPKVVLVDLELVAIDRREVTDPATDHAAKETYSD